ncbi:MAG: 1,4-dihydroxy-2-naphthoate polyprenyltransferase [Rhodothermales bacterium]
MNPAGVPTLAHWLEAARPKTLPAAAAPVVLGVAIAVHAELFHALAATLALLAALCIQIATNFHNDVADFEKGADGEDRLGPRRLVASGLIAPRAMRTATYVTFGFAVAAGMYLMIRGGWPIVAIGTASVLSGLAYTGGRYSLAWLGVADAFVFVFFGPIAVAGTVYVQGLTWLPEAVWAGLGPGALSVAILLVNNLRDREQDRAAGKRTLVVRMGRQRSQHLYAALLLLALAVPVGLWLAALAPTAVLPTLLAGIPMVSTWRAVRSVPDHALAQMNPLLGQTARNLFLYCGLFSLGWLM